MISNEDIAKKVYAARVRNRLSQEELGKLLQVSKQSICSWEKGRNLPDIIRYMKILELDGMDVKELFRSGDLSNVDVTAEERALLFKLRSLPAEQVQVVERMLKAL